MTMTCEMKRSPTWNDAKATLSSFDRAGLIGLIKDLYALNSENRAFLQARLALGIDPLAPYKGTIARWICPDVTRGEDTSIAKAKKAISDYRKATGLPEGMAELSVFYCEQAASLISYCGIEDEGYFNALVRMYEQALSATSSLLAAEKAMRLQRLDAVRAALADVGWGVKDAMDELWIEYANDDATE
jgi:hypothetical protein